MCPPTFYSVNLILLFKIFPADLVIFRVVRSTQAHDPAAGIIILPSVVTHTDSIYMMDLSLTPAQAALPVLNARDQCPVYLFRPVGQII